MEKQKNDPQRPEKAPPAQEVTKTKPKATRPRKKVFSTDKSGK